MKNQRQNDFRIRKKANSFQRKFLKFPERASLHSLAELYYAALLESDRLVMNFTPQPDRVFILDRPYIPDFRVVRNSKVKLVELKPGGVFNGQKRAAMEADAKVRGYEFEVVSNQTVFESEIKARNWLSIINTLLCARHETSDFMESELLNRLMLNKKLSIGEIVDSYNRVKKRQAEIAMYRLLHRGVLQADLETKLLNYGTNLWLAE